MKTLEMLLHARAIITDPVNWLQGRLFDADRKTACAVGAVIIASKTDWIYDTEPAAPALSLLASCLPDTAGCQDKDDFVSQVDFDWHKVAIFNNTHTHEEVLTLFDLAIAKALVIQSQLANTSPSVKEPEIAFRSAQLVGV